jgi:hypothetical protein
MQLRRHRPSLNFRRSSANHASHLVYPRESVVAEKFEAILQLGMTNSRMKDYYDLWFMSRHFEFVNAKEARVTGFEFESQLELARWKPTYLRGRCGFEVLSGPPGWLIRSGGLGTRQSDADTQTDTQR